MEYLSKGTVTKDLGIYLLKSLDSAAIQVRSSKASEPEKHHILSPLIISYGILRSIIDGIEGHHTDLDIEVTELPDGIRVVFKGAKCATDSG